MQIVSVMNQRVKISPAGIDAEAFPKKPRRTANALCGGVISVIQLILR